MKRLLPILFACASIPAAAADLPAKALPAPVVAAPVLSGWYLDLMATGSVLKPGGGVDTLAPAGAGASFGGGYDFTTTGLILGVYGSLDWINVRGTATCADVHCTVGSTIGGEIGGRVGFTFAQMNSWLGNSTTFQNINGRLVAPLQPLPALNQAIIYAKGGLAFDKIKASVNGEPDSRVDVGLRLGAGVEIPVYDKLSWRTVYDYTRYENSVCGGCALPTGRPAEHAGRTGIVIRF